MLALQGGSLQILQGCANLNTSAQPVAEMHTLSDAHTQRLMGGGKTSYTGRPGECNRDGTVAGPNPSYAANLWLARDRPEVLREKLTKEISAGRIEGSFTDQPFPNLRVSPLRIPKKEASKYQLIQHLSHPKGSLVNNGISLGGGGGVTVISFLGIEIRLTWPPDCRRISCPN